MLLSFQGFTKRCVGCWVQDLGLQGVQRRGPLIDTCHKTTDHRMVYTVTPYLYSLSYRPELHLEFQDVSLRACCGPGAI